jgi:hypothetical protein
VAVRAGEAAILPGMIGESKVWLARTALAVVLVLNLSAALPYLIQPARYLPGFELEGAVGEALVRGLGVLFLMWNATYPPVIAAPDRHKTLFAVVLAQQLIGIVGEVWIAVTLPAGHAALRATGLRFLLFDGAGLAAMTTAFILLHARRREPT